MMLTCSRQFIRAGQEQWIFSVEEGGNSATASAVCDLDNVTPIASLSPLSASFFAAECYIDEVDTSGAFVNVRLGALSSAIPGPIALLALSYPVS